MTLRTPAEQFAYDTMKLARNPRRPLDYAYFVGNGNPEGVVSAPLGSFFRDSATSTKYKKTGGGTGNTGWTIP